MLGVGAAWVADNLPAGVEPWLVDPLGSLALRMGTKQELAGWAGEAERKPVPRVRIIVEDQLPITHPSSARAGSWADV